MVEWMDRLTRSIDGCLGGYVEKWINELLVGWMGWLVGGWMDDCFDTLNKEQNG